MKKKVFLQNTLTATERVSKRINAPTCQDHRLACASWAYSLIHNLSRASGSFSMLKLAQYNNGKYWGKKKNNN